MNLNDQYGGRCCGRNLLNYKRDNIKFCPRCQREFDATTGEQKENFAWKKDRGVFVRVTWLQIANQLVRVDEEGNPI